ncbi:hypothetical protein [Nocardioides sp. SR21]|uniref:hypothetical protein n=1 Tax=Nocardioides sp. SR21 TaxID=2919501 RepID=UPI001FAAD829|nr:hypothetical protein [Nocardioides sp. SR21]
MTGTKGGYADLARTSAAVTVVPATLTGGTPTISGNAKVGVALIADAGSWSPQPVALAYQWLANGAPISGATAATYTPSAADARKTLAVRVTGTKAGYATLTRTSTGQHVATGTLKAVQPRITGKARVGKTLKVVTGAWKPAPVALEIQWYAGGVALDHATGPNLRLTKALKGQRISVEVTGSKAGYSERAVMSAATGKVAARR